MIFYGNCLKVPSLSYLHIIFIKHKTNDSLLIALISLWCKRAGWGYFRTARLRRLRGYCGATGTDSPALPMGRIQFLWSNYSGFQIEGPLKTESLRKPPWILFQWTRGTLLQECGWDNSRTFYPVGGEAKRNSQQEVRSKERIGRTIREVTWWQNKSTSYYLGLFHFSMPK